MKMILTLRSGVQLSADVTEVRVGKSPLLGELRELNWKWDGTCQNVLQWIDLSQVAAVQVEHEPGGKEGPAPGESHS